MTVRLSMWRSLRLRLPGLISCYLAVVMIVVVGVINRQIQSVLLKTGVARAEAAADQVSTVIAQGTARGLAEVRRAATQPALIDFLADRTRDTVPIRNLLATLATPAQPPVQLWRVDGTRLLEVGPTRGQAASLDATVPLVAGLTSFQTVRNTVFYAVIADVRETTSMIRDQASREPLGYIVVRRTLTTPQTTETLNRLVGDGASIAMGHPGGGVWTNFSTVVPAPPTISSQMRSVTFRADTGDVHIGARAAIVGTPWAAWVDFPQARLLAPARAIERRLIAFGIGVVVVSAALVSIVSSRLTTPVSELMAAASAVAAGDYSRRVSVVRRDEIGLLTQSFNTMVDRLNAVHRALELRVQERTSRLSETSKALEDRVLELNAARAELDRFFSLSLDLLCIADTDGRFRRLNPAWAETLGWSADELTGVPYLEFVHPDDRDATTREASALAAGGTTVRFENRYRAKDGSYHWLSWKSAVATDQRLIYAAARDVTDEKRIAAARDQSMVDLKSLNDELESFSYTVSHDLRAPLRHIAGFAALLEKTSAAGLTDDGRRYLATITEAAGRMGRLIDDLLAFSRLGRAPLERHVVNLETVVADAIHEVRRAARHEITWRLHPLPTVEGDVSLLRVVFINLLANAAKYSSSHAHPVIEVGVAAAEHVSANDAVVYVRDNGVGFDMTYADKLFGVFQRLHSSDDFEGTGIGLATVRRIVHRHHGKVWAEGAINVGATFYVSLPKRGSPA